MKTTFARSSLVGLAVTLGLLLARPVHAHQGSAKYIETSKSGHEVTVHVDVEAIDAALALGLGVELHADALRTHGALIGQWLARGLTVRDERGRCPGSPKAPTLLRRDGTGYVGLDIVYRCSVNAQTVTLHDATIFADDPEHEVFVTAHTQTGTQAHVLRAREQTATLSAPPSAWATAKTFVGEGARHLVTGTDHLLFVLSLVLVAGLLLPSASASRQTSRRRLRDALHDVTIVVTSFTVGHSMSLALASLGLAALPSAWVEFAIAATIVYVAILNVARPHPPDPARRRVRVALALGFGLIHGFGFSSVLGEMGLPTHHRILALASFNLGIELAQLAFVALAFIPLSLWARYPHLYRRGAVQGGSLAIATVGCVWLAERSLNLYS